MQRRHFSKGLVAGVSVITAGLMNPLAQASEVALQENKNFWLVKPALPNDAPAGKVQVIEFFAYSCNHCFAFESIFNAWAAKAPADAYIQRVPVSFRSIVEPHARIYYTLEALDRLDLHDTVFEEVQVKKNYLIEPKPIRAFFAAHGINADEAMKVYESFGVQSKVQRANQLVEAYGIEGTPAIGIGGQYWTIGASQEALRVAETLIARVKASMGS